MTSATMLVVVKRKTHHYTSAGPTKTLAMRVPSRIVHVADQKRTLNSEVPYYEEEEVPEEYEPEPAEGEEHLQNGEEEGDNVIISGDPSAAAKENVKSHKDKKIPNDQRITTPYMTKYEKARILGTRALQIRYEIHAFDAQRRTNGRERTSRRVGHQETSCG